MTRDDVRQRVARAVPTWTVGAGNEVVTAARGVPRVRDPAALTRAARARFGAAAADAAPIADEPPTRRRRARRRWSIAPRAAVVTLLVLATVTGAVTLRSLAATTGTPVRFTEPGGTSAPRAVVPSSDPSITTTDPPLLVHVVGQVAAPGLVELSAGARVSDALTAAGGPLPDADLAALNLAAPVQDGEQVRVPAPGESAAPPESGSASTGGGSTGLIDINRANATELQELPGVGPVLADRIVAEREASGPFAEVDDLDRVSGIGPAVLAKLRDRTTT